MVDQSEDGRTLSSTKAQNTGSQGEDVAQHIKSSGNQEIGGIVVKYVYPAIFYAAKEGGYCVEFPDVQGAATQGETLYEAMEMAEDALAGMLVCHEDSKAGRLQPPMTNRIVEPTPIEKVVAVPDEYSTLAFVVLIKADTDEYRKTLEKMKKGKTKKDQKAA